MTPVNLDGRVFYPVQNSQGGRVTSKARFHFQQIATMITANYSGENISDGHIIGTMLNNQTADLLYHSRAADGALEAGRAKAKFEREHNGAITIYMEWQWLAGPVGSGQSIYKELL